MSNTIRGFDCPGLLVSLLALDSKGKTSFVSRPAGISLYDLIVYEQVLQRRLNTQWVAAGSLAALRKLHKNVSTCRCFELI